MGHEEHTHQVVEGEVGFVTEAKGYLLALEGLPSVFINDIIINERGERALVTAIYEEQIEALLLDEEDPQTGDRFMVHPDGIGFSFSDKLFGRVVNALGDPLDGKGSVVDEKEKKRVHLEAIAPGMSARAPMVEQLLTGMPVVDILLPLSKGQRQLLVGPVSSGKTVFVEHIIAHQRDTSVLCIYAFIGRPLSYVRDVVTRLLSPHGNPNAISVAAFSDEPAPVIYITPTIALSIAEYFAHQGKDVLLVLDDLGTHAKYLREISLLSGRIPGRESYPGDMFYQHAYLMERAGRFNKTMGNGSITLLPILETNIEDITNLISTNLMAATDGHLFFSPALNAEGYFPSVAPSQSVTRVGRRSQSNLAKQLSIRVQALLAEYEKQQDYSKFGTQLSENVRKIIKQGEILRILLRQEPLVSLSVEVQLTLLSLVFTQLFNNRESSFVEQNRAALIEAIINNKKLEPIVTTARRGTISLEQFVKRLQADLPTFESVCQGL
jgi:F-type H+-transporting ATPase subunit alpha